MSSQLQVTGEAKIRDIQGPVVANGGVITALNGAANQYVRGDGTLASFPSSGGGGNSVSYYLNGSVSQGNIAGQVYYQMSKTPIIGAGTNFSISSNGLIAQFITDAGDPDVVSIPGGNWNLEFYMNVSASSGALASFYVEFYKWNGSNFTLIATNSGTPEQLTNTTTVDAYYTSVAMPTTALAITDRIAVKIFANVASKTVTLYTEDNRLCQIVTTFSNGLTTLNNLTDQSQYLAVGTSGTDFNIVSSGDTHTFNIPNAGSGTRGLITSGTQTIAGAKSFGDLLTAANLNVSSVLTIFGNLSNGTYNYTLPVTNGQLALTSQIPTISGTPNQVTRFNSSGSAIEGSSITDNGSATGSPAGQTTINARLAVNNYTELNRYLSIIQNIDSSWSLPSTGTSIEAFITSAGGGLLDSDTAYLRPRKASDDTYKRFVIQGNDLILNDAVRRTLINKAGPTQSTTKLEVAGYTRFDNAINVNSTLYFNATDASQPTYITASSGNLTALTTGSITLGTNGVNKFVFDANGALNLGTSDNSNIININNQFSTLNSTIQGVHITPSIVSAAPVIYTGVKSFPQFFISGALNFADIKHFSAINASNTNTTSSQIGLYIDNLTSNSIAYGIQSTLSSGSGKYNLYIDGTAINYLKGRLGVDQTNPQYAVDVTGDVNVTGNFKVNGTNLTQGISGNGTNNYIPKFLSSTVLGDSSIYQSPSTGHVLVNTTYDYFGDGGYLQVGSGFTTESFANIIYGFAPSAGNSVYLRLVNGNSILGPNDRTYFIENRMNVGATSANYYLNYWNGGTTQTRYSLDSTGLHTFEGEITLTGLLTGVNATFSQKIGIGTTTGISASMTVFSSTEANQIKVAGAAPATVFTDSLSTPSYVAAMGLCTATNNFIAGTTAGDFVFANQKDKAIIFGTGVTTTEKMRLTPLGYLLLGTTSSNGAMLQVNGSATFANQVKVAGGPDNGILVSGSSGSLSVPITGLSLSTAFNVGYITNYTAAGALASLYYTALNHRFSGNGVFDNKVGIGVDPSIPLQVQLLGANAVTSLFTAGAGDPNFKAGFANGGGTGGGSEQAKIGMWYGTSGTPVCHIGLLRGNSADSIGMTFNFAGNETMRITSAGNVGIGTSSPAAALHVRAGDFTRYAYFDTTVSGYGFTTLLFNGNAYGYYGQASALISGGSDTDFTFRAQNNLVFLSGGGSERMRITSGGSVTIANLGTGLVYSSSGALTSTNPSDERLKDNITDISWGLSDILKLRPVSYHWKDDKINQGVQFGFIAQEVQKVMPEAIKEFGDEVKYLGLEKDAIYATLVKAIQELEARIKQLENK